jgi:hypothetical protein
MLDTLIQLHETHQRLAEINELKGDLPEILNEQENKFNEINNNQSNHTDKINDLSKQLSSLQSQLTDHNTKLEKYNNQLLKVTNNKEYDAVLLEMDHLKATITDVNTNISNINTEMEQLNSSIETNAPLLEELSEKIKLNKEELVLMMSETDKEEHLLSKNQKKLAEKIKNEKNLSAYNRLYEKYGQGMAHTVRKSCTHCYTQLPPQLLVEIEYDKKVISCPSCSVFLYHKKDND